MYETSLHTRVDFSLYKDNYLAFIYYPIFHVKIESADRENKARMFSIRLLTRIGATGGCQGWNV